MIIDDYSFRCKMEATDNYKKKSKNILFHHSSSSDENGNFQTDEDQESAYSYETMSDGLAELLGSEVRSLEEVTQEYGREEGGDGSEEEEEEENSKENLTRRYTEIHGQTQSESQFPAIKLTFKDSVNISQLKTIKSQMQDYGRLYGDTEIISEHQLKIYFHEVSNAWSALQWIYNSNNSDQGLRDFGNNLRLLTADYSPISKWISDFDGLFTIKVSSSNIKKIEKFDFFVTFSRFGHVRQIWIDPQYSHVLVRYSKQIDAEKAIASIDRSYFFSSWCRAVKSNPVSKALPGILDICDFPHSKVHRKDIFIKSAEYSITRDSWKKMLTAVSESGIVEALFGHCQGVVASFSNLADAHKCWQSIPNKKFNGKTLIAQRQFRIDEIN
jgi:hypothetical protein